MPPPEQAPTTAAATFAIITGEGDQTDPNSVVTVHFNPASLQLSVTNELKDTRNNERKQYVAKTSAKLTMDLVFDTTETGEDVMRTTRKLQGFLSVPVPPGQTPPTEPPPPLVLFEWGTLRFKGIAENYRETIDYFSPSGVPLRSSINLTLSRQDKLFDDSPGGGAGAAPAGSNGANDALALSNAGSPAQAAAGAGSPGAARSIAAANGQESLRFGSDAPLSVSASVQLKPAAAFSAGAGASAGGGAGFGVSIGGGAGVGLSLGAGGSLGGAAGAGVSGLASLSATEGAFAGLATTTAGPSRLTLDPSRLLPSVPGAKLSVDAAAGFNAGGQSGSSSPAGLRADVGVSAPLKLKITFDPT